MANTKNSFIDKNGINRDPDLLFSRSKHVGEVLGNQYILNKVTGINRHNQTLYEIECIRCGHVYTDARIPDINRKIKNNEGCAHGSDHTTYNRWTLPRIGNIYNNMKKRCYDPSAINYCSYGAKGIKICKEWLDDPSSFDKWALSNGYQDTFEINRKNHNKGYSPNNCEWVPPGYNSKFDKSDNYIFYIDNERYTTTDIDKKFGFSTGVTRSYISAHGYKETQKWIDDMLNGNIEIPTVYNHTILYSLDGLSMSLSDWARYLNTNYSVLYYHFTHDTRENFIYYIRNIVINNLSMVNIYGYYLSFIQISNITRLNINYLKDIYMKYGSEYLLGIMQQNGVIIVGDKVNENIA